MLNFLSKLLYSGARQSRDVQAVNQAIKQGSAMPLIKRLVNKWLGRNIVSKIWWR